MTGRLLTLNVGSSSIKFAVFAAASPIERPLRVGQVEGIGIGIGIGISAKARLRVSADERCAVSAPIDQPIDASTHEAALAAALSALGSGDAGSMVAVGHRIVHGGVEFEGAARIDATSLARIEALVPLAPLHQPHNLAGVRAALAMFPEVPQVACFDTAFHRSQSDVQQRFAIAPEWHDRGVRRYGFHGLSYASIAAQLAARGESRIVVAHLGNGASLCAMRGGRSVATTMSFSPLDGLTMGTRAGHIDAAAVLHLQRAHGLGIDAVETLLTRRSGLLGLSGISSDMRELEASSAPGARLAIDHFVGRLAEGIAAMAAALRGIDILVFTAGIGENAVALRARVVEACSWLGLELDAEANRRGGPRISAASSRVEALVLRPNEEAVIAAETLACLGLGPASMTP